jgi:hypothetical protein
VLEIHQPQVKILSPRPDEVFKDNSVTVRLQVQDFPAFKNEDLGMGPHLHVILDNQPYRAVYDPSEPLVFEDLTPGTHTIRAFASRPWHESFKNEGAFAQTTFHIFAKTPDNTPDPNQPLLTYSRPQGEYGAEPVMLDFYLNNVPLHLIAQERPDDDVKDWKIRCTINGESFEFDEWQPIYLKGLKPGKNWVQLELLDEDGNPFSNAFNNTVRVITYTPNGTDTLSKLVRGELSAVEARGIVDPNYVPPAPAPEPIPEPEETLPGPESELEPIPEASPEPEVNPDLEEPEPTASPETEAEQAPEELAPEEEIPEVEEETPSITAPESDEPESAESETPDSEAPNVAPSGSDEVAPPEAEPVPPASTPVPTEEPAQPSGIGGFFNRFRLPGKAVSPAPSPSPAAAPEPEATPDIIVPATPPEAETPEVETPKVETPEIETPEAETPEEAPTIPQELTAPEPEPVPLVTPSPVETPVLPEAPGPSKGLGGFFNRFRLPGKAASPVPTQEEPAIAPSTDQKFPDASSSTETAEPAIPDELTAPEPEAIPSVTPSPISTPAPTETPDQPDGFSGWLNRFRQPAGIKQPVPPLEAPEPEALPEASPAVEPLPSEPEDSTTAEPDVAPSLTPLPVSPSVPAPKAPFPEGFSGWFNRFRRPDADTSPALQPELPAIAPPETPESPEASQPEKSPTPSVPEELTAPEAEPVPSVTPAPRVTPAPTEGVGGFFNRFRRPEFLNRPVPTPEPPTPDVSPEPTPSAEPLPTSEPENSTIAEPEATSEPTPPPTSPSTTPKLPLPESFSGWFNRFYQSETGTSPTPAIAPENQEVPEAIAPAEPSTEPESTQAAPEPVPSVTPSISPSTPIKLPAQPDGFGNWLNRFRQPESAQQKVPSLEAPAPVPLELEEPSEPNAADSIPSETESIPTITPSPRSPSTSPKTPFSEGFSGWFNRVQRPATDITPTPSSESPIFAPSTPEPLGDESTTPEPSTPSEPGGVTEPEPDTTPSIPTSPTGAFTPNTNTPSAGFSGWLNRFRQPETMNRPVPSLEVPEGVSPEPEAVPETDSVPDLVAPTAPESPVIPATPSSGSASPETPFSKGFSGWFNNVQRPTSSPEIAPFQPSAPSTERSPSDGLLESSEQPTSKSDVSNPETILDESVDATDAEEEGEAIAPSSPRTKPPFSDLQVPDLKGFFNRFRPAPTEAPRPYPSPDEDALEMIDIPEPALDVPEVINGNQESDLPKAEDIPSLFQENAIPRTP